MACVDGHFNIVSLLLEKGASPYSRDLENRTPLWLAARRSQWDIVKFLLNARQGPKGQKRYVNWTDNHRSTALHAAAQGVLQASEWDSEVAQSFIHAGADVDLQDDQGCTAAHYAFHTGVDSVVRLLAAMYKEDCTWINQPAGAKFLSQTCLHMSAANGRADDIEWLLERMDQQSVELEDGSEPKRTAWEAACGNKDATRRLDAMGAFMSKSLYQALHVKLTWKATTWGEYSLMINSLRAPSEQTGEI